MDSFDVILNETKSKNKVMPDLFHDSQMCRLTGLLCPLGKTTTRQISGMVNPIEYPVYRDGDCRMCNFALVYLTHPDRK